jgi:hypothetical protein
MPPNTPRHGVVRAARALVCGRSCACLYRVLNNRPEEASKGGQPHGVQQACMPLKLRLHGRAWVACQCMLFLLDTCLFGLQCSRNSLPQHTHSAGVC